MKDVGTPTTDEQGAIESREPIQSCQEEIQMRSELVFKALVYESNRYQLCRLIAKGTRKLHRPNTRLQETANDVLERFGAPVPKFEAARFAQPEQDRRAA
jgi:hypothetical protein